MKKFFLWKQLLSTVDLNDQRNQGTAHYLLAAKGSTVFPRINAAAFIKFFMIWVRRLFEGGVYLK